MRCAARTAAIDPSCRPRNDGRRRAAEGRKSEGETGSAACCPHARQSVASPSCLSMEDLHILARKGARPPEVPSALAVREQGARDAEYEREGKTDVLCVLVLYLTRECQGLAWPFPGGLRRNAPAHSNQILSAAAADDAAAPTAPAALLNKYLQHWYRASIAQLVLCSRDGFHPGPPVDRPW